MCRRRNGDGVSGTRVCGVRTGERPGDGMVAPGVRAGVRNVRTGGCAGMRTGRGVRPGSVWRAGRGLC